MANNLKRALFLHTQTERLLSWSIRRNICRQTYVFVRGLRQSQPRLDFLRYCLLSQKDSLSHEDVLTIFVADQVCTSAHKTKENAKNDFKNYTDEDWKKLLSPQQYHICREKGTEPPWSGELVENSDSGTYCCVCCNTELFQSSTKFDSQSGWPSFWSAIENKRNEDEELQLPNLSVDQQIDYSHGMVRVEVLCKQCGSHLGHVFRDGPQPTGLRYCINSCSLHFKPDVQ